jgi:quinolinate synthase
MAATAIDLQPYASLNDEDCDRRIDPLHLAWVLENLIEGNVVNQISVPKDARIALQRMLDI